MTEHCSIEGATTGAIRPRLLYIGSLPCEPLYGGPIQLHRHFIESGDFDFQSIVEPQGGETAWLMTGCDFVDSAIRRVSNTRLQPEILALNFLLGERRIAGRVMKAAAACRADAIVTVAFGTGGLAAGEVAQRLGLPLITFFHDWWPDLIPCRGVGKRLLDDRQRRLYRRSRLALCVCPEMRDELGDHPNAPVLYPVPAFRPEAAGNVDSSSQETASRPLRVVYLGALEGRYGEMAQALAKRLLEQPDRSIELAFYGSATDWPADLMRAATERGIYRGRPSADETARTLQSADAFLALMDFDAGNARRVRTSLPSKVLEYCAYGKPLIGWAPEYSSLAHLFRSLDAGCIIDDPTPERAITAIAALAADQDRQTRMGLAARRLAETSFNPRVIHAELRRHIERCIAPTP